MRVTSNNSHSETFSYICSLLYQGSPRPPPEVDASALPQISAPSPGHRDQHCGLLERTEAERDDSHACLPSSSISVREEGTGQRQSAVVGSTAGSSSIWSSLELDVDHSQSHKGISELIE